MKDRVFYVQSKRAQQWDTVKWRDCRHVRQRLPRNVAHWLLDEGSLTHRLQWHGGGQFSVLLLSQQWARPQPDEREIMRLGDRELAQVRQTLLRVDGEPWVFARSILPMASLQGANRHLRQLGNRSLGSWLFRAPQLQRSDFQVARIQPHNQLVPVALQQDAALWGRRSRFEVAGAALLVCEIFLPAFRPWQPALSSRAYAGRR